MSHRKHGNHFMSEALALRDGLVTAWNHGGRKILCELDCKELVNLIKLPAENAQHAQLALVNDIRQLLRRTWTIEVTWIHREENAVADWLAKRASRL